MFSQMSQDGHERLFFKNCRKSGLKAVVAIHNPEFDVAFGGTRITPFVSDQEALHDVLRLSRAMTLKAACAGIPVGGAKGVIVGDLGRKKEFLPAYGDFVASLGGQFVTGPDVNLSGQDAAMVAERCPYIVGLAPPPCDTGTMTAYGVLMAMRAAAEFTLQKKSLSGLRVAIQGIGNVGWLLAEMLTEEGAEVSVADVDGHKTVAAAEQLGARVLPTSEIHRAPVDIFAPCAYGGILNQKTLPEIPARIIVGAANNQMLNEVSESALMQRLEKVYVPDFVANAGGLIAVYHEFKRDTPALLKKRVEQIFETSMQILQHADQTGSTVLKAAEKIAESALTGFRDRHQSGAPYKSSELEGTREI